MADLVELNIAVDSSSVTKAAYETEKLTEASKKATQSVDAMAGVYEKLAGAISAAVVLDAAKTVAFLAARYEMLGATMGVMANNVGMTSLQMQNIQIEMEKTGISALRARQGIQIMAAAEVDLSKAAELGRVAQDGATLAGINSSEAFAKLVQGISTGESRIIRHMGIMVNFKTAINDYARANNMAVQDITEHDRAQVRLAAVLSEGAKRYGVYEAAMTTAGKQMLSLVRYTENFQVRLGETFNPATTAVVFEVVALFKDMSEALKAWQDAGDQAVFSEKLRQDVVSIIEGFKTFVGVIYEARTSIEVLLAAFAMYKIVGWVQASMAAFSQFASGGVAAYRVATMSKIQYAASAYTVAAAEAVETRAEVASHGTKFITNALRDKNIIAMAREAEASALLAVRSAELAAAETLRGQATIMANRAMTALGGPIGLALLALAALLVLIKKFRDNSAENTQATIESSEQHIRVLKKEMEQWDELDRIKNKEQKKKKETEFKIDDVPQIRKLITDLEDTEKKFREAEKAGYSFFSMFFNQELFRGDGDTPAARAFKQMLALQEELAIARGIEKVHQEQKEKKEKQAIIDAAARKDHEEKIAEVTQKQLYYKTQMSSMQEKITDANLKGLPIEKEQLEYLKIEAETTKKIADWTAMYNEVSKKGIRRIDKDQLQNLIDMRMEEERRLKAAIDRQNIEAADVEMYDSVTKSREANDLFNKSLEETVAIETERIARKSTVQKYTPEEIDQRAAEMLVEIVRARRQATDANYIYAASVTRITSELKNNIITQAEADKQMFAAADARSGGRLKATERPEEMFQRELAQLNADFKAGKMNLQVYERALISLQATNGSAWSAMAAAMQGYTDQTSQLLANYFNGVSGSWNKMFASMIRDMEVAMIKAMIMKPIMDGLAASLRSLSNSGGPGMWASFLQAGWGIMTGGGDGGMTSEEITLDAGMPGRASGGPVSAGRSYMVGEKGPERFTPGMSGTITPNNALGGNSVVNYITVTVADGQAKSDVASSQKGGNIADQIEGMMTGWALKNMRPGGLFNKIN